MLIEEMSISDLLPAAWNPRTISDEALSGLETSISRFGLVQPVVFNRRTGHVVGGHQRLKVLQRKGEKTTQVVVVDIPEEEEKALNVTLNNKAIQGEFTADLKNILNATEAALFEGLRTDQLTMDLDRELAHKERELQRQSVIEDMPISPPPKTVWALVMIPTEKYAEISSHLEAISKVDGVKFDSVIR